MFYTVYKTTNLINGNFYLGCHKSKNPNDDYLGSGRQIEQAVQKYGSRSFRKDVLFVFDKAEDAFEKEKELITAVNGDQACYNMHEGGFGGFDYINRNGLAPKTGSGEANPHFGKKQTDRNREAVVTSNKRRRKHPERTVLHIGVAESNRRRNWREESRKKLGDAAREHRTGKPRPLSVKLAVAEANRKRPPVRWINRNGAALKVQVSRLNTFFAEGWQLGRK